MNHASLQSVVAVARDMLSELDLDRVLPRVVEAARTVTGAQYAALGVIDPPRTALERFITSGIDDETRERMGALPTGRGVLGELIKNPAALRLADIGHHPRSYGFPVGHPPMRSFLGVPVMIRGQAFGNLYLTEKSGAEQFDDDDQDAVELLARFAALAIDHAQRFTDAENRRAELERTVDALDATLQIARALGGQTDLEAILELVAKRGRALVAARTLIIEHVRDGALVVAAGAGALPADLVGQRVDPEDSVASAALRTHSTLRLEDEPNRLRFERHGLGRLGLGASAGLVVPLIFRGQAYGALVAIDRVDGGPAFSDYDQSLLEAFAVSAATAVATALSAAEERRRQRLAAAEEERTRWARELHDETLQALAALRLRLSSARRVGTAEALDSAADDVIHQIDSEIVNLRALITDLRPAALDELGVGAAIEALVERTRTRGLEVETNVDLAYEDGRSSARLDGELETALYRVTQEALTNAQKHGEATHAVVEIVEHERHVTIRVRDDGRGFDPSRLTSGLGLVGMRERAELLGGTVHLSSEPGGGAEVRVELPTVRSNIPRAVGG